MRLITSMGLGQGEMDKKRNYVDWSGM
jgi:hypothetical protein